MVVLERTRDNLGGRGSAAIDQDDQGCAFQGIAGSCPECHFGFADASARGHDAAGIQEQVADFDSGIQQATRIAAQIKHGANQGFAIFLLQIGDALAQFAAGLGLELGHAQIGVTRLQQASAHAGDPDDLALELEFLGFT